MIEIPLNKKGKKHVGKYVAIVSDEDKDLADFNWSACFGKTTNYVHRNRNYQGKQYNTVMHRLIMERMIYPLKLEKGQMVDHINRNGLDNRRENLRIATKSQNNMNRRKRPDGASGFKGVTKESKTNKWVAQIGFNKKIIRLGTFDTPELAHEAYCEKAKELFGEFFNKGD